MIRFTVTAIVTVLAATPAVAQQTREEEWAARQAEKATKLRPYEASPLERRIERIGKLINAQTQPLYPFLGSAFPGGGIAFGSGFAARYGDTGAIDGQLAWSLRSYKVAAGTVTLPKMARDRIGLEVRANWLDAPSVAYFGVGNESNKAERAGVLYRTLSIGIATRITPAETFSIGCGVDALKMESGPARVDGAPISRIAPMYTRTHAFAEVDWRTSPGYTTRGGLYRLEWADYRQTNSGSNSFARVDAEVRQFVPLLRENWVLAFRALASTTSITSGETVPHMLLPDLGGSHTLRGYSTWRFRDRSRLLLSGEYRWKAGQFLDMALFVDAGRVAPRLGDLGLSGLRKSYGLGMSFHTPIATVTRIELARTREGMSLGLSFSPSF